ncbi:MAG: N-acetylmuramoyl-L-alanine amidase [Propionicimonas sp.]|nr:N-acetylmuramoyl-L-alanine amidase [Propionicimonas sp.]
MRGWLKLVCVPVALLVGGCSAGTPSDTVTGQLSQTSTASASAQPVRSSSPRASATPTASGQVGFSPSPEPTALTSVSQPLKGKLIVVDPGHNGKYSRSFNTKKVPAGNGKRKACNSSGTAGKGLSEHAYTWAQAKLLRTELKKLGATVVLTRENDSGLGPCVNKRAKVANDAKADLLISLHADGNVSAKARGFHVIISTTMAGGPKLEKKSRMLATNVRAELQRRTAMPRSTYIGKGTALSPRKDIATLNLLTQTPGVMLEIGNMRHSKDLALLKSSKFRTQVAQALAQAAVETLGS